MHVTVRLAITKRIILFILFLFLLLGLGFFLWVKKPWSAFTKEKSPEPEVKLLNYQDDRFKFKVQYPVGFVLGKISPASQVKDPVMLKLVREEPPTLVLVWQEGLGMVGAFVKTPLLQYLQEQIDRKYKVDYHDFKKEKVEKSQLAGLESFTVWFTFQDPQKSYREKIKLTVTTKNNVGVYLQCQAPEAMWDFAEPSCDVIKNNFEFLP